MRGTLWISLGPSPMSDAAMMGKAAFLLPAGRTVPLSGTPPITRKRADIVGEPYGCRVPGVKRHGYVPGPLGGVVGPMGWEALTAVSVAVLALMSLLLTIALLLWLRDLGRLRDRLGAVIPGLGRGGPPPLSGARAGGRAAARG